MEQAYQLHGDVLAEHGVNKSEVLDAEKRGLDSSEKPEAETNV